MWSEFVEIYQKKPGFENLKRLQVGPFLSLHNLSKELSEIYFGIDCSYISSDCTNVKAKKLAINLDLPSNIHDIVQHFLAFMMKHYYWKDKTFSELTQKDLKKTQEFRSEGRPQFFGFHAQSCG